jgi:hypothetical protein
MENFDQNMVDDGKILQQQQQQQQQSSRAL